MDYPYENLSPDKFQEFCQALLAATVKDFQCFPIGQADGGRDAISFLFRGLQSSFAVYQVKFVRNPNSIPDPHKWLSDQFKNEAPKVNKLIPKGAKKYIFITNVKGTGPLNSGSIDKFQTILR